MKQLLQDLRSGEIQLHSTPAPAVGRSQLRIETSRTLISSGTERSLLEFGRGNLLAKARSQPDKVRQVLQKMKADGVAPTLEAVFRRLDEPMPLGYSNVGRVLEVGSATTGFKVGDRVVSNGAHAEIVSVPANLAARIPDDVEDETASFTVLGSIALNGIRLIQPTLGETVVVFGLGLLGQLAVQLLRAHGCRVIGLDPVESRCALARSFGAETLCNRGATDVSEFAHDATGGRGADAVLITATAPTDGIMHDAAQMSRKKGRIVLVGVVGLSLNRADFYEKELSFQVACSYGPGRYDSAYEEGGQDYSLPWVRWTVARNFEAVLHTMATGALDIRSLVSKRFAIDQAAAAYESVLGDPGTLGVVLEYASEQIDRRTTVEVDAAPTPSVAPTEGGVGLVGAGQFTRATIGPALKQAKANVVCVASAGGRSAAGLARKLGARDATTDVTALLARDDVSTVFLTTRHDLHASMVVDALDAGKHVFVEKPLALDHDELDAVAQAHARNPGQHLLVGFNRRFAPHAVQVRELLDGRTQPIAVRMLINAGAIDASCWVHDPKVGGGRIIGEACHFLDLALFLVGSPIDRVQAVCFDTNAGPLDTDKMAIHLTFEDGSIASIDYLANGSRAYPKETIEVLSEGRMLQIDNWRRLRSFDWPAAPRMWLRQDKGHRAEVRQFLEAIRTGAAPLIPFGDLEQVTRASFAAVQSAEEGRTIELGSERASTESWKPELVGAVG